MIDGAAPHAAPVPTRSRRSERRLALAGVLTDLALAAGIGMLRAANSGAGERHAEGLLPTIAIAVVLAGPGVLALIGLVTDRPVLFGAGAIACAPLALVSIAAFPIALPAFLLLLAFVRGEQARPSTPLLTGGIIAGFAALLAAALFSLVTMTSQFTYRAPGGGSESGDFFTPAHAAVSIVIVCVAVVAATALALFGQRERGRAS